MKIYRTHKVSTPQVNHSNDVEVRHYVEHYSMQIVKKFDELLLPLKEK